MSALTTTRWTFQEFILAWSGQDSEDIQLANYRYRRVQHRQTALQEAIDSAYTQRLLKPPCLAAICKDEIRCLTNTKPFSRYTPGAPITDFDFGSASQVILDIAPTWSRIIQLCLQNQRGHQSSYSGLGTEKLNRRLFMITVMVCFSHSHKMANAFPSSLGVYLHSSGVPRRVLETLAGLGICHGYHHINHLLQGISEEAKVRTS